MAALGIVAVPLVIFGYLLSPRRTYPRLSKAGLAIGLTLSIPPVLLYALYLGVLIMLGKGMGEMR